MFDSLALLKLLCVYVCTYLKQHAGLIETFKWQYVHGLLPCCPGFVVLVFLLQCKDCNKKIHFTQLSRHQHSLCLMVRHKTRNELALVSICWLKKTQISKIISLLV